MDTHARMMEIIARKGAGQVRPDSDRAASYARMMELISTPTKPSVQRSNTHARMMERINTAPSVSWEEIQKKERERTALQRQQADLAFDRFLKREAEQKAHDKVRAKQREEERKNCVVPAALFVSRNKDDYRTISREFAGAYDL